MATVNDFQSKGCTSKHLYRSYLLVSFGSVDCARKESVLSHSQPIPSRRQEGESPQQLR